MWRYVVGSLGLLALVPALMAQERPKDSPAKSLAGPVQKAQTAPLQEIDQKLAQVRQRVAETLAKIDYTEPQTAAGPPQPREFVWIEDAPPAGANLQGHTPWEFVGKPHPVHSGEKSSRRSAQGISQHFFTDADPRLKIGAGDKLFAYVYLDPNNPPKTIMLQFNDGNWEHRACWGEGTIPWGAPHSPSRRAMGKMPKAGEWVRLEVAAAEVGLKPDATLDGWAFTQHDGTVYWDKAGIVTRTPQAGQAFDSLAEWDALERAQSESFLPRRVRAALTVEPAQRSDSQKKLVRDYFLEHVYTNTRSTFGPLHQELAALRQRRAPVEAAAYRGLVADYEAALASSWTVLELTDLQSAGGATLARQPDGSVLAGGKNPPTDTYTFRATTDLKGIDGFRLEVLPDDSLAAKGPGRAANGNFVLSQFTVSAATPGQPAAPVSLVRATATFNQDGYAIDQAIPGVPQRGWAVAPRFGEAHSGVFEVREAIGAGATTLTFRLPQDFGSQHTIGRFRISATTSLKAHREQFAPRFLEFAEKHGGAPAALDALLWVIDHVSGPRYVDGAVERIVRHHLEGKALLGVCQRLANPLVANGEKLLRAVLKERPHRDVQGWACFALARHIAHRAGTDESLHTEAERLLERALQEFADVRGLGDHVRFHLAEARLGLGRAPAEIEMIPGDPTTKLKLQDHRGKVVLLAFCRHC